MSDKVPPQYVIATVEAAILEIDAELHPQRLTAVGLAAKVIAQPSDAREVEVAEQAVRNLREFGLFRECDDESLEPTGTALHAVALLT